jgi:hypothetical protein
MKTETDFICGAVITSLRLTIGRFAAAERMTPSR